MYITIKRTEELEITPLIFKDEKEPPKFVFRTPNSSDMLKYMWTNDLLGVLSDCFVRFENKIVAQDETGKEIPYKNYREFINLGLSGEILLIHQECIRKITEKLNEMATEAEKTEKKLKSGTKSSKADKKRTPKD